MSSVLGPRFISRAPQRPPTATGLQAGKGPSVKIRTRTLSTTAARKWYNAALHPPWFNHPGSADEVAPGLALLGQGGPSITVVQAWSQRPQVSTRSGKKSTQFLEESKDQMFEPRMCLVSSSLQNVRAALSQCGYPCSHLIKIK